MRICYRKDHLYFTIEKEICVQLKVNCFNDLKKFECGTRTGWQKVPLEHVNFCLPPVRA